MKFILNVGASRIFFCGQTFKMQLCKSSSEKRLESVEGLRGLAMTLVFFGHFESIFQSYLSPSGTMWKVFDYFADWGHRGIGFFLVITGYFVYGTFVKKDVNYLSFVKRRLFRIYPLYWTILTIYLGLMLSYPAISKLPKNGLPTYLLGNALLLQGFMKTPLITVSWAITYLVLTYLIVPIIIKGLQMRRWLQWQRILAIIGGAALWLQCCGWFPALSPRIATVAVGMLVFEALQRSSFRGKFGRSGELVAVLLVVLSFSARFMYDRGAMGFLPRSPLPFFYPQFFSAVGIFYFCAYVLGHHGVLSTCLSGRRFRFLGEMSYSYYLTHGLVLKLVFFASGRLFSQVAYSPALFLCNLPICYLGSICTARAFFNNIEKPLALLLHQKAKDRSSGDLIGRRQAEASVA